jgi:Fe-S-cluster containining protein
LASGHPALVSAALRFPYKINASGACEKLINNQCSVYEARPLICRVDELTDLLGDLKAAAIQSNIEQCNRAIQEAGLDESFLIKP